MYIYLIRHGETDWNGVRRLQGRRDIPLNENGRAQIQRLGEFFSQTFGDSAEPNPHYPKPCAVYSSPLSRAADTAHCVARKLGLDAITEQGLIERDFSIMEGSTYEEVRIDGIDRETAGEPIVNVAERMKETLQSIAVRHKSYENIVCVTHGGIINPFLRDISGMKYGTGKTNLICAGITLVKYEKRNNYSVVFVNKTADQLAAPCLQE